MLEILQQIEAIGIVPVIKIDDADKAVPLAKALVAGGIPCIEVTFRTAAGVEALRRISAEVPEILAGAGTVTTTAQVDEAIAAGARFAVSPGFNPAIVDYCAQKGLPIVPGCSNPSDMELAMERGLEVVKFFPAQQAGGLPFLKAVAAPYTKLRFMPTGGINPQNLTEYLAFDRIVACGGTWMVPADLLAEGRFDEITALCRGAMESMLGFELRHIGINGQNEEEALQTARWFETLFGFGVKAGAYSVFAGTAVEVMKQPYLGKNGHIAIGTNSVPRARAYLQRMGAAFDDATEKKNADGNIIAVYLKDEIAGFAVHLVQK